MGQSKRNKLNFSPVLQTGADNEALARELMQIIAKEASIGKRHAKPKTFAHPRFISNQITHPSTPDLFSETEIANTKVLQAAQALAISGGLANTLSLGIEGSVTRLKVIKALMKMLYEESYLYGTHNKTLAGAGDHTAIRRVATHTTPFYPADTTYPTVITTPTEFCRLVANGGRAKTGKNDTANILNELEALTKKHILKGERGEALTELIHTFYYVNDQHKTLLRIEFMPFFAKITGQNFVRERTDILSLMCGARKEMTWLLYEVLIIAFSQRLLDFRRDKESLWQVIAKSRTYSKQTKRRQKDFEDAVSVMRQIRLVAECADEGACWHFRLNGNHLQETFPPDFSLTR